jgi:PucR family transcriptional regulator, purine catabolism regulatory protein
MNRTFTIEDLINKFESEGLVLKAGKKGIKNVVNNVNTIDNPDSIEWFLAGDFIMTTGYIYRDDAELQKQMVRDLAEQNCSGLGIKIKRYWDEIPKVILQEANKVNLPVIEIPYKFSLSQVANLVNLEVHRRSQSLLSKYRDIHKLFTQVTIKGGSLTEIAELTTQLIESPVIILDSQFNLLSYADTPKNPLPLNQHVKLVEREKVFPKGFNDSLPTDTERFTLSTKRHYQHQDTDVVIRIIPITYSKTLYGYLLVWETVRKLESIDYIALESAAQSCAIERVKMRQLMEAQMKQRTDFFDDLLAERILSVNAVRNAATTHGLNPNRHYVVVVIDALTLPVKSIKEVIDLVEDQAMLIQDKVVVFSRDHEVVIFVEVPANHVGYDIPHSTRDFIETLNKRFIKSFPDTQLTLAISNICNEFLKIGKSYSIARDIIRIAKRFNTASSVNYFQDVAAYHLLDAFEDQAQLQTFYQVTLGALDEFDQSNNAELIATLEAYFDANMNISQAAKDLYIHRNTIIYRLDKIQQILKQDIKSTENMFNIQLALRIRKLL